MSDLNSPCSVCGDPFPDCPHTIEEHMNAVHMAAMSEAAEKKQRQLRQESAQELESLIRRICQEEIARAIKERDGVTVWNIEGTKLGERFEEHLSKKLDDGR